MNVGTTVKAILPCDSKNSIQYEQGVIIYIGRRALVEFFSHICGHDGNGLGKDRHCWLVDFDKLKEVI